MSTITTLPVGVATTTNNELPAVGRAGCLGDGHRLAVHNVHGDDGDDNYDDCGGYDDDNGYDEDDADEEKNDYVDDDDVVLVADDDVVDHDAVDTDG